MDNHRDVGRIRQAREKKKAMLRLEIKGPVAESEEFVNMLRDYFPARAGLPYVARDGKTSLTVVEVDYPFSIDEEAEQKM